MNASPSSPAPRASASPSSLSSSSRRPRRPRRAVTAATALAVAVSLATLALLPDGSDESDGVADGVAEEAVDGAAEEVATVDEAPGESVEDAQVQWLLALARREPGDPMAVGRHDAPVVLIEYSDFRCPFCGHFARETKPELLAEHVETGVLRIEWRHFPILGDQSDRAALASWAAGRQDRFWEFHDLLFAPSEERGSDDLADAGLIALAEEAGVPDLERFREDMDSTEAEEAVARDRAEGLRLGVSSTPAFLVNTTPILGAQPTEAFTKAIEAAATEAKR
ncbi:DsbA family protein [Streptomyces alkaliphilus]|uniref:DsbA family protein n=1 Tax=Streptomyces alkaliphilus TaxID=1472722 RepID=UPI00117F6684|nr:DsbA family protein [Streptomyces alkaliphilus]MQS08140.1 thioredoxin domain-containing protein [Streptomyces alkaliphilus]